MFRGEPVAYFSILMGFVFFIFTQLFGLLMPGVLFASVGFVVTSAHYILAFYGWIGMVILGAQLQFFRAISNLRKFEPQSLRYLFLFSLPASIISSVTGIIVAEKILIYIGYILYLIGVGIHTYWIFPRIRAKLFRFPLTYFIGSHIFLIIGVLMTGLQVIDNPIFLSQNYSVIHVLGVGWISLSLQGALVRALPMFVGNVIDRGFRKYIDPHFYFSFVSSLILGLAFIIESDILLLIGSVLWIASWVWIIALLISSIILSDREIDYKITIWFVLPGLLFMILGVFFGYDAQYDLIGDLPRGYHIHTTLLAGLALIMLGVIHRVNSFQAYTLLNNPKDPEKESTIRLDDFLKIDLVKKIWPGFIVSPLLMILGFSTDSLLLTAIGGTLNILFTLAYGYYLFSNFKYYLDNKDDAIPFWLKASEYHEQQEKSETQD